MSNVDGIITLIGDREERLHFYRNWATPDVVMPDLERLLEWRL